MDASPAEQIFGPLAKPLHLGISVTDLETSIEWYSKYLGFTLTKQVDLPENLRIAFVICHSRFPSLEFARHRYRLAVPTWRVRLVG